MVIFYGYVHLNNRLQVSSHAKYSKWHVTTYNITTFPLTQQVCVPISFSLGTVKSSMQSLRRTKTYQFITTKWHWSASSFMSSFVRYLAEFIELSRLLVPMLNLRRSKIIATERRLSEEESETCSSILLDVCCTNRLYERRSANGTYRWWASSMQGRSGK